MRPDLRFDLDGVEHAVHTDGPEWTVVLRRSVVAVRHPGELDLLAHDDDLLVPCRVVDDPALDSVTLLLTPGPAQVPWADLRRTSTTERLRALANVGAVARLADRGYAVLLDPGNLLVDRNLAPRLLYRGVAGAMPPEDPDGRHLLHQYQALALSTLDPRTPFRTLLDGARTVRRRTALERAVTATTSVAELAALLAERHDEAAATEAATQVRVARRRYTTLRHATAWLAVGAVVTGGAALHQLLVRAPFDARMLEASTRFVAQDHDGVIEVLRPVDEDRLPAAQRYQLAASYLRTANLTDAQRAAVENSLSLASERDFLSYWVLAGRGDLEEALDRAKGLDDVDLVLYALTLLQEQVRQDPGLSGTERADRLAEIQAEYDATSEQRLAAIEAGLADDEDDDGGDGDEGDDPAAEEQAA